MWGGCRPEACGTWPPCPGPHWEPEGAAEGERAGPPLLGALANVPMAKCRMIMPRNWPAERPIKNSFSPIFLHTCSEKRECRQAVHVGKPAGTTTLWPMAIPTDHDSVLHTPGQLFALHGCTSF